MKIKTLKRVSVGAVAMLLLLTLLFVGSGIGQLTVSAADHISEWNGQLNTHIEDYFNSSVIYQLPDTINDNDWISVIVNLDNPSILDAYDKTDRKMSVGEYALTEEAQVIRQNNDADKKEILAALDEKNIAYETGANYTTVLSGFEILIEAKNFESVVRSLGNTAMAIVGEVYNKAETQLVENEVNFDETTGIFDSTGFAYDGSGMLVAVLDTGLDYTHSAFSMDNFTSNTLGLTKEQVASLIGDTKAADLVPGLSADDVYVSDKVPFSFDYADEDSDVYSLHNNHGTHVSGVIVGHDDTIRGVAPNAQLISMKIFSDVKESAYSSWILSALEDCVILGVDVINMSLGTACGFSREMDKEAITGVYDRIRERGISLVVAASNSFNSAYASDRNGNLGLTTNPDTATVGSPSTYDGAMSVASINGVKTPYLLFGNTIIYFDESTNASTKENNFFNEILPEGVDSMPNYHKKGYVTLKS
ncbi:MAG: S8 family serine peptidase, partial [Clostridia bacterium]|nr:S8 family serine peptidase [Clostridia bacterium]